MGSFGIVSSEAWTDPDVVDNYTPEDKYLNVYLLTNPHHNISGCYQVSFKQMGDEMGYTKEAIENLIERHEKMHKTVMYSKETKEILILNWYKHHWTRSPKYMMALEKQINNVKNERFKNYLNGLYNEFKDGKDTVSIPYPYGIDTSISITNTNTNTKSNNVPSLEEVKKYVTENKLNVDAEYFYNFFTESNWIDTKGTKVNNWKQKLRTWDSFSPKNKQNNNFPKEAVPVYDTSNNVDFGYSKDDYDRVMKEREKVHD